MKIYVVNCGKYDCVGVDLATEDIRLAVKLISERVCLDDVFDSFNSMECWEDGQKLYTYTSDIVAERDILKEVNRIESKLEESNKI